MKLFVANIARQCTEEELNTLFAECGEIKSLKIIKDRETKQSRGFGFVEMNSREGGEKAILELNGKKVQGRALVVAEAQQQQEGKRDNNGSRSGRGRTTSKG